MKAAVYEEFEGVVTLQNVPDPAPEPGGVVIRVEASGLCRSDWHGWMGHDPDIVPPHVPGHELAGVITAVGGGTTRWKEGDRVTLPFVCGCGACPECVSGNQQVCDRQFQPGFTHWGSFAEYVSIHYADANLVALPEEMEYATAASLGCRFATSFRALVHQGRVRAGEWAAVHGCGGVGLSAVMIAAAQGAGVVAVDIGDDKLAMAETIGATHLINARTCDDVVGCIRDLTGGGAHVSIDALGSPETCWNSISCLRKRGRHVQIGLMLADHAASPVPFDRIVAHELEIYGSHGIQAHCYAPLMDMIRTGRVAPQKLIGKTIDLAEAPAGLMDMDSFSNTGVTVITEFPGR